MAVAPTHVRWSQIREISLMITRMYLQRSGDLDAEQLLHRQA